MGLFKNNKLVEKWKDWRKKRRFEEEEYEAEDWSEVVYDRKDIDMNDREQRQAYVKSCLEQIADATREVESLNYEYGMVTSYLKDMEEIEALPEEERREIEESAQKIGQLESSRGTYLEKKNRMSDEIFHRMERLGDDVPEGIEKLKEAEEYQDKIKQDMGRLEGEKHAFHFRKTEVEGNIADLKGIAIICSVALIVCFLVLAVLQFGFKLNTQMGYLGAAAVAAITITIIYLKHLEAVRELKYVEKGINRLILLQNRVKIRYVNNTNLLDYLYMKYKVSSGKELKGLWEKFLVERDERKRYRQAELELDDTQQELLALLKCYQLKDPSIWLRQTEALLDNKEMVEIRHNLIIRRQSLRKRIDYNKEVIAAKAQKEIKDLVDGYPQYAEEILRAVSEYEKKYH